MKVLNSSDESRRLSADERKRSILEAAVPLFAEQGFSRTTTRQIAEAAGVSEALLYRHFPSKEAMYLELPDYCCGSSEQEAAFAMKLEPSTSTLVFVVYYLVWRTFLANEFNVKQEQMQRLMTRSLLDDGTFARIVAERKFEPYLPKMIECVEAAKKSGDLLETALSSRNAILFTHHIGVSLGLMRLQPPIAYDGDDSDVLKQAVAFALRGMGLKDEAIKAHYNPETLEFFIQNMHRSAERSINE